MQHSLGPRCAAESMTLGNEQHNRDLHLHIAANDGVARLFHSAADPTQADNPERTAVFPLSPPRGPARAERPTVCVCERGGHGVGIRPSK
jgi:hypothetical protein